MKNYIGIDLGTTNSAICSYDGETVRLWKSPDQHDVTPSAIYIDRRGNKYLGKRAYDSAPHSPDNAALLFKRFMGTSTPMQLPAVNLTLSPEECSAEILKVLFGYLPEELRNDAATGTVITVPAAFNQMQKDATMRAAELAGIGKVALMQEPVAAVMTVMRARKTDGIFVVYDIGGGTLDVAVAESSGGRVNLLAHGGIAVCGGRDFDRMLVDNVVKPWLFEHFELPEDLSANSSFKSLLRLATWAAEKAKIELSAREDAVISLPENEVRVRDRAGTEVYLDIPLQRATLDQLIDGKIDESIEAARETLSKAGLTPHDVERIVFVGGPTYYKPLRDKVAFQLGLRDKVAFQLGIPGSAEVNPMTAVAEGAAVFAESIDWASQSHARKSARGKLAASGRLAVTFNYTARTPDTRGKIIVQLTGKALSGAEFQIDSLDTGWTSGRMPLAHGASVEVSLPKSGDNAFKVFVFDAAGGPMVLEQDKLVITRTAATVDGIPASHSIALEVLKKVGGGPVLLGLISAGDRLPKKGSGVVISAESLKAGGSGSLRFKLWEGDIEDPVTDNRFIGMMQIRGSDFDQGVIPAGDKLLYNFEMLDSGNLVLEVSVPSIGAAFHSDRNFYSAQGGELDYSTAAARVAEEGERVLERIEDINRVVEDPKLDQARDKLEAATTLDPDEPESESTLEAMDKVLAAKRLLAQVRKEHRKEIWQLDLDGVIELFNQHVRQYARPSEATAFDNQARTAQRGIDRNDPSFESHLKELKGKNFEILWRQDWFVVERFKWMASSPHHFSDQKRFDELVASGLQFLQADDIAGLKTIIGQLWQIQIDAGADDAMLDAANIIRGE